MTRDALLLCHRIPFPPNKGDKIRSHALLQHLAERGPVHLACFIDDPQDLQYRDEVRRLSGGQCLFELVRPSTKWRRATAAIVSGQPITTNYFRSRTLSQWVRDIVANQAVDDIIVFGSAMAPYLLGDALPAQRAIFDMVDVDSDKWQQYARASRPPMRWIYAREARMLERLEKEAARAFAKTLLVSPFEAETFRAMAPDCAQKISALTNGVDLIRFSPGNFPNPFAPDELPIVMTGRMDYRPNSDGATWLAKDVAPKIFAKLPKAHIYFVGSNPPVSLTRLRGPRITVTGAVDDVRPYLEHAAAVVAPLLIARGVQNKVLEAMAMRKPVVATREATRALDVRSGVHLWIENDPQRFADCVIESACGPTRSAVMRNGRRYVEQNHDWMRVFSQLDALLEDVAGQISTDSAQHPSMVRYHPKISGAKA